LLLAVISTICIALQTLKAGVLGTILGCSLFNFLILQNQSPPPDSAGHSLVVVSVTENMSCFLLHGHTLSIGEMELDWKYVSNQCWEQFVPLLSSMRCKKPKKRSPHLATIFAPTSDS
jgi:hypothetical protein